MFSPSCKHPRAEGLPEKSFNGIVGIWITRNTIRDQNLVAPLLHPCLAASSLSSNLGVHVWYRVTVHNSTPLSARINCWQLVVVDPQFEILPQKYPPLLFFYPFAWRTFDPRRQGGLADDYTFNVNSKIEVRFLEEDIESYWKIILSYVYVSWKNVSMVHSSWGSDTPMT